MRVPEISVSRNHATIYFENGNFYIDDTNSKYGTLVLIQKDFYLLNNG
jgi:pSer/pThr/pTyr-binding forkhead associated (FHA) protein